MKADKILLLDGMSLAHRAFYALPDLTTAAGEHVNAALGFLNMFYKLYDEEMPRFAAVAFDLPAPTFRHRLFKAYKGTREAMPFELRSQIPLIKNLIKSMNITIFEKEGYEADDILGTLARLCEGADLDVMIVTGDRDLLQTATEKVCIKILRGRGGEAENYYAADVTEKIGVTPKQFIDVKALMGDTSDNIPGVPSIGEKTALKIIKFYGSTEAAIENAADITPKKASENLSAFREQALLSKTLATIDTDAPINFDLSALSAPDVYGAAAFSEIKRLEFKSLYGKFKKTVPQAGEPATETNKITRIILENDDEIKEFISGLQEKNAAAYSIAYEKEVFQGISFSYDEEREFFIRALFANLDEKRIFKLCRPFFEGSAGKYAWDAKADKHRLAVYGIELNNITFDVMLCAYVLNESGGADSGAAELFAETQRMRPALKDNGMEHLYYDIELPLLHVLYGMERTGISADRDALKKYGELLGKRIDALTLEIYNLTGEEFNINSPKQLGVILFEKLGLPEGKKTKTGYSTAADVLERLAVYHPAIGKILEYRQLTKLKSTYADGLLAAMDKTTGKIYSTFNQAVTATGRLSSTEPNLQNIPVRTELGCELRKVFVPSGADRIFTDADYSQIELRVLAHMSGDETFIDAFNNGLDIHRLTASEVFGVTPGEVTPGQRSAAKAVNFGIIYGQSAFSLASDLGITVKEAERYIDGYFRRYPRVKTFMDETVRNAKKNGSTTTITGRRRRIPELSSPNHNTRAFGERAAMNMPIQGSAADIIKIAMIRVHDRLKAASLKSRLILQVHDELLIETHRDEADAVNKILKEEMEQALLLNVPLTIDINTGNNWYEAK